MANVFLFLLSFLILNPSCLATKAISCGNDQLWPGSEHSTRHFHVGRSKNLFVEMLFVCDRKLTSFFNDEPELMTKTREVARRTGVLLLDINVTLIVLDILVVPRKFYVGEADYDIDRYHRDFNKSLHRKYYDQYKYDGAILFSGHEFGPSGIFVAGGICGEHRVGGLFFPDGKDLLSDLALSQLLAHEIGHGLGLQHDTLDKSGCSCQNCVMTPRHGFNNSVWSTCSKRDIKRQAGECVLTACGNGIVEEGEECDCGSNVQKCPCCDRKTCKITEQDGSCEEDGEDECNLGGFCDGQHFDQCEKSSRPDETPCSIGRRSGKCSLGFCKITS